MSKVSSARSNVDLGPSLFAGGTQIESQMAGMALTGAWPEDPFVDSDGRKTR